MNFKIHYKNLTGIDKDFGYRANGVAGWVKLKFNHKKIINN